MNAKELSALLESSLKQRLEGFELEKEKFTTPDQMRMHKEAKAPGYNVVYRDKAFDKTYTAQIPPGISKAEIVKMLKRTIRVGLEVISIQPMKESAPGYKHDCAAKVVHETYGKGDCIPEKHTLIKEGNRYVVTHYDVLFESGKTVEDIPVKELKIVTQNEHWHKDYKKKKKESVKEGAISPRDAKKLSIGDTIKTQKNTYKITGYGSRSNAFRQFEAEDAKGNKYNIQVSLRGNSDIGVAAGRSLRFSDEMLESVNEASDVWKIFDLKQKLYGQAMDMEDDLKSIAMDLKQKRADMEQEAEPGGGKIADRYGKELRKLEKDYNKKRHELKKVRDKIDKLDNKYVL